MSLTWKVFIGFVKFGFKSLRNLYKIQLSSLNGVKPKKYVHRFPAAFDDGFFVVVNNGRFSPLLSGHAIEKLLIEGKKLGIEEMRWSFIRGMD